MLTNFEALPFDSNYNESGKNAIIAISITLKPFKYFGEVIYFYRKNEIFLLISNKESKIIPVIFDSKV